MMSEEISSRDLSHRKDDSDSATLSELFDNAFELFNSINNTAEPTNSSKVQVRFSTLIILKIHIYIYTHICNTCTHITHTRTQNLFLYKVYK